MRTRNLNLTKRLAALEVSLLMRPSGGVNVIERSHLPDPEKQILKQALQNRVCVISPERAERLNAAIDALPAADRTRVHQAMEHSILVILSGSDARLL